MVGYQCGLVFRACCVKGQETTDFAPADNGDPQETGNSPPFLSGGVLVRAVQREVYIRESPLETVGAGGLTAGRASRAETQEGADVAAQVARPFASRIPSWWGRGQSLSYTLHLIRPGPPRLCRTICFTESLLIRMLISSKNTSPTLSRVAFDEISGNCGPPR